MKNTVRTDFYSCKNQSGKHLLKIMKVTAFLLFFCLFSMMASNANSQNAKISIVKNNATLLEILNEIENQSHYLFMYSDDISIQQKVSVRMKDKTVAEVLDAVLDNHINYEIEGNHIVLSHTPNTETAQQGKGTIIIKGHVADTAGLPIIGANILEKGVAGNGVVSDIDGNFSLQVQNGATLIITYIGYTNQEIKAEAGKTLQIVMKEDAEQLNEVVVVGYGVQKKANLSGSVAYVDNKMLTNRPVQNVSSALQGLMPGVTITSTGGRPGMDGASINIRGIGTLNTASPYILVDGVETGTINSVDPNDIESISVLKDAASAAIYGSKAANGVILITTKRGTSGTTKVTYSGNIGIQQPTATIDRLSSYDYARLLVQSMKDINIEPRFTDEELQKFKAGTDINYPNTQWYDLILRTGFQHKHNVNISGGTEKVKYMGSLGYLGQNGILPNSERNQINARTNLDMQLTSKLTARLNMAFIRNNYSDPTSCYGGSGSYMIFRMANRTAPWIVGRYDDGTYGTTSDGNPLAWLDLDQTVDRNNQNISGTAALDYEIIKGLKATISGSYVGDKQFYKEFVKYIRYNENKESDPNRLTLAHYDWERKTFDALLNFDKQINRHNLKAMAGWHAEKYDFASTEAFRRNFPNNDLTDMNAGETKSQTNSGYTRELAMLSYFARVNYDYAGKYLLETNVRADASSRFAPGHRWGYFPSFSFAWRINEENFMENTRDWLNNLKLRASIGLLGNQDALNDYYPWMTMYGVGTSYPFGGELSSGYDLGYYKSSTISWEKTRTWGVALEATIWNSLNASVEYYDKKTTGIIMDMPVPIEFGYGGYKSNIGALSNKGVEITLGYNKNWGDWSLNLAGNFSYNKNKLLDLGDVNEMVDPNDGNKRRVVGKPLNSYYTYVAKGFFSSNEEAQKWMDKYATQEGFPFGSKQFKGGDLIYQDTNKDGKITDDDRILVGSATPSYTYGLNIMGGYKGIDLSLIFTGTAGGHILLGDEVFGAFDGDNSHPASVWLDSWTPENKDAKMPRISYGTESPSSYQNVKSDFWLYNTSYIRLKNLQIGYTFPQKITKLLGVNDIRMYYSIENVFTISNMPMGIDPEISSSTGADYPLLRTHSIGLNLSF